jgi:hypothetical protein
MGRSPNPEASTSNLGTSMLKILRPGSSVPVPPGSLKIGRATDNDIVYTDTRILRAYNVLALRIGWRRLGENAKGKYPGLAEATERAFAAVIGTDVQPVTPELRAAYVELSNALAWCGAGRG